MKKNVKFGMLALCICTILAVFTGCGKSSSGKSSSESDSKEVSVACWAYDANPEMKAMVSAFEKANKGVKVKIVDIDATAYEDKITTMLASGDTTDVLGIKNVGSYVNYASKKQLVDMTKAADDIKGNENFKGSLDSYKMDGKLYALPYRKETWMLFYNKDIFDKMGIAYPKNLTWDEYEDLAKKMTTEEDGQKIYGTYHEKWYSGCLALAANQMDKSLLDGKYDFLQDYLDRWTRMQGEGATMDYSSIKTASVTYSSQFETGKTAMMPMGSFYAGKLVTNVKDGKTNVNWGVTSLPQNSKDEVVTFGGPTGFAVNKHSKNQKLAKKFVAFCAGEEGAKAVAGIGMTPAYQSDAVMDVLFNLEGMPQDEESKNAFTYDKSGVEMAPTKHTAEVDSILSEEYDLIMVGDKSVKDGIKEMEKRVKEVLNSDD